MSETEEIQQSVYEDRRSVDGGYFDLVSLTAITIEEGSLLQQVKDNR